MKYKNMIGKKFGRLTIEEETHSKNNKNTYYKCKCECGKTKIIVGYDLVLGRTKSCGCIRKEKNKNKPPHVVHGKCKTRLYKIYTDMKTRCYNENYNQYYLYGGRGIKICKSWLNDFENFYNWAIKNDYKEGLSIDRIDNNKNYEPNNCRWVDKYTQANNKRNNVKITYNNETHTIAEWSKIVNISYQTLWYRYNKKRKKEDV